MEKGTKKENGWFHFCVVEDEFSRMGSRWSEEKFGANFPIFFQSLQLLRWVVNGGLRFRFDRMTTRTSPLRLVIQLPSLIGFVKKRNPMDLSMLASSSMKSRIRSKCPCGLGAGERSMLQVKLNVRLVFCERGECLFHIRFDQVKVEKLRSKEAPVEAEPALKFMCWFSSIPVREERLEL
ncbi:hypothetical protein LINPERPRIM_LOCUS21882 [Linum perenne]